MTSIDHKLIEEGPTHSLYSVALGYHLNNITLTYIFQLTLFKTTSSPKLSLIHIIKIPSLVIYLRIYSHYLYSFNRTHVTKFSLMTVSGYVLYTHQLERDLGNPLQFVRNVGQYMLLAYVYNYRILDLESELLGLVVDENVFHTGERGQGNGLGNIGVYDMVIFGSGTLLLGINNIMRSYDRDLLLSIGSYPKQVGKIRTCHSMSLTAVPFNPSRPPVTQQFNLTVDYETKLV